MSEFFAVIDGLADGLWWLWLFLVVFVLTGAVYVLARRTGVAR